MIYSDAIVGAATSRPPTDGLECSVEWHHVGDRTNSPALVTYCGFVPRGRLRASPTVGTEGCADSPNLVTCYGIVPRGRLVAAPTNGVYDKIQFNCPRMETGNPNDSLQSGRPLIY